MPSGRKPGKKAQPVIPACSEPSAHRSIQRWGAGSLTVPCLASQLRVKESGKKSGVLCGSEQRRGWLKYRVEGQRRQVGLVPEPLS